MKLLSLRPSIGATQSKKRPGRGNGSGLGRTAGRGEKDTMPEVVAKTVHGSKEDKCRSIDVYLKEVFLILFFVKHIKW